MKYIGRTIMFLLYLAIPLLGWYLLWTSFKKLDAGQISAIKNVDGTLEVIKEPGIYFRPLDSFLESYSRDRDIIDFGAIKIVRIREGQEGVKTRADGTYEYLASGVGVHEINLGMGETFNSQTGIQNLNQESYVLGAKRIVTVHNGQLGGVYEKGIFKVLEPGRYELKPTDTVVPPVPIARDIVNLDNAFKIITVKTGQVAIVTGPKGAELRDPGKWNIVQQEGYFFNDTDIITVTPQLLHLNELVVMCSDRIEMKAEAVLVYSVEEPLKMVGVGQQKVETMLKELAEGTLLNILRQYTSADIAQSVHEDESHSSSKRAAVLQKAHDQCVQELATVATGWGLKITDLKFTKILPANKDYERAIQEIGIRNATAEAQKSVAEQEAAVEQIRAANMLKTAEIGQQTAAIKAATEAKVTGIQAEAELGKEMQKYKAEADGAILKAKAQAESIKLVAEAQAESIQVIGKAADQLSTPTAQNLAMMEKQKEMFNGNPNIMFVPQPEIMGTTFWKRDPSGQMSRFSNQIDNRSVTQDLIEKTAVDQLTKQVN